MKFCANQSPDRTLPSASDIADATQPSEDMGLDSLVAPEQAGQHTEWEGDAVTQLSVLTPRQHQIMELVLAGKPSKNIATDLGISRRTVENHRAAIMLKTGSKSIPALARLAFMPKVTVPNPVSFLPKLSLA